MMFSQYLNNHSILKRLATSKGSDQTAPYAQADLMLCWSHIPHCWKSHALAKVIFYQDTECAFKKLHIFSTKTYVLSTQTNDFNRMVLLK